MYVCNVCMCTFFAELLPKSYLDVLRRMKNLEIDSPSKSSSKTLFESKLAVFSLDPPFIISSDEDVRATFQAFFEVKGITLDSLMSEEAFYGVATRFVPSWVDCEERGAGGNRNATSLYGGLTKVSIPASVSVPWQCFPEFFTKTREERQPGYNGEIKSAGTGKVMLNEGATYAMLSMMTSFFPVGPHRFYAVPPVGYSLLAFPHCGYLLGIEWVGRLFVTPVSQPFFIASKAHEAAILALTKPEYSEFVSLQPDARDAFWQSWPSNGTPQVMWTVSAIDGMFYKIIYCSNAVDTSKIGGAKWLRGLYETYGSYEHAFDSGDIARPSGLVRAQLMFGAFTVLVKMPFVEGHELQLASLNTDDSALSTVAEAMCWLARRRLLYVDVRERNLLRRVDGSVIMVDYDDMILLREPVEDAITMCRLLREKAVVGGYTCALDLHDRLEDVIKQTWS